MKQTIIPTHKQAEAYRSLLPGANEQSKYVLFGGGAGGGKSWLGCEWLIGMAISYPGTRYFIGRDRLKDINEAVMVSFNKVATKHGVSDQFQLNRHDNVIKFRNGSTITLLDLRFLPSDPFYERYGSAEYTSGWIEEGGEVHFSAFDTLKTRIGRSYNDRYSIPRKLLVTANPKKNWLYQTFFKPWKEDRLPAEYVFIQALVGDNPYGESNYIQSLRDITDKVKRQRLLLGEWDYDSAINSLFQFDWLSDSLTADYVEEGDKFMSVDVARLGEDLTVIMIWSGWRLTACEYHPQTTTDELVGGIQRLANLHQIPRSHIVIDSDGVGAGVVDYIDGVTEFVNISKAAGNDNNYDNLKTQCYYKLAQRFSEGQIFIGDGVRGLTHAGVPVGEILIEELSAIERKNPDTDRKLKINTKDQVKEIIGRSPDFADCVMMRQIFELNTTRSIRVRGIVRSNPVNQY